MSIPSTEEITKDHVLAALEFIDKNGVPKNNESDRYDLVIQNNGVEKKYPPKYVVAVARQSATNGDVSTNDFTAIDAKNYLEGLGFFIADRKTFELTISRSGIVSTDNQFTMDNLSRGDCYKPVEAYFKRADGSIIERDRKKGEKRISNQTLPSIACQIFQGELTRLTSEEKNSFPICQYSPRRKLLSGIYPSVEAYKSVRKSFEYMVYDCGDGTQFVFYCWNIFSTLVFVKECLMRFGKDGDKFVLVYKEKDKKEKDKDKLTDGELEIPAGPDTEAADAIDHGEALTEVPVDANGKPYPRNCIYFGAPGTGKSYAVDDIVKNDDTAIRTTFHPDSDYPSFVGAYKPTMNGDKIAYEFVPQAFTKAYVQAWEKMATAEDGHMAARQYLVIEEINRGNCAQIFGDLFQLLDRDDEGYSKYPIYPDADIKKHLYDWFHGTYTDEDGKKSQVNDADGAKWREKKASANSDSKATWADILSGSKLVLPPNLYIWATMNTSDQSLFPMDSAFKRRWDWKYSKIKDEDKGYKIVVNDKEFPWWNFLKKINDVIRQVTQSADKQLGYFFVSLPKGETSIDAETFVNKVIFYLWNDVFRDCELDHDAFKTENEGEKDSESNTNAKRQLTFDDFLMDDGRVKEKTVTDFLGNLLKTNAGNSGTGETSSTPAGDSGSEAASPDTINP